MKKNVYVLLRFRMIDLTPIFDLVAVFNSLSDAIFAKDELVDEFKEENPDWNDDRYGLEDSATCFEWYEHGHYLENSIRIDIEQRELQ